MFAFGRLSERIVWPTAKVAGALPPLLTVRVQLKGTPRTPLPLTSFVLAIVRSGAVTVTVLLAHALLPSLLSTITLLGSMEQVPAARGLAKVPMAVGVALNCTPKVPVVAAITT